MESNEDVENLSRAIEKLLHEKRKRDASGDFFIEDEDDQLLLSRLISQLESPKLKGNETIEDEEAEQLPECSPSKGKREGQRQMEESIEELTKEMKKVKKQNTITHILLSTMIFLTLAWQLSEYSMLFMLKDRISHPVRSIGGMLGGMFKGKIRPFRKQLTGASTSTDENNTNNGNGTESGPHLQVPELLREFGFDDDEER